MVTNANLHATRWKLLNDTWKKIQSDYSIIEFFPKYLYAPLRPLSKHLKVDEFNDVLIMKSRDGHSSQA